MLEPRRRIETDRLVLLAPETSHAHDLAEFFRNQREHLAPWSPVFPEDVFTEHGQVDRISLAERNWQSGNGYRYLMTLEGTIIGTIGYSQVFRGPFQNAYLGYAIGREWEGKGLMFEALRTTQAEMFSDRVRLHRIQANAVPENQRSLALLDRLGFVKEGLAKEYLQINGEWRDHVLTSCTNPDFDPAWL